MWCPLKPRTLILYCLVRVLLVYFVSGRPFVTLLKMRQETVGVEEIQVRIENSRNKTVNNFEMEQFSRDFTSLPIKDCISFLLSNVAN